MKKLAIIGSSEFQLPLIKAAKEQGIETHVFSWGGNEDIPDFFYQISIVEKDDILQKCKDIGIDGICSIGSDLANITVNYIALAMGLVSNSEQCTDYTTNKHLMRNVLKENNIPIPEFVYINESIIFEPVYFPIIVKPIDRSGSRGITLVEDNAGIKSAIEFAYAESFSKEILIEQFITGREFSVESISFKGKHEILQITEKFTTGSPDFIEKGHICPARVTEAEKASIFDVVYKLLDAVCLSNGASHTELKINENGDVYIIEIGSRMGGDYIGSDLVLNSTGFDFTKAVLAIALGEDFCKGKYISNHLIPRVTIVKFIFNEQDLNMSEKIIGMEDVSVIHSDLNKELFVNCKLIKSSSDRQGHILLSVCKKSQNETLKNLGL
tara:strand:+ start:880 stop:2028 length:1149 start_codon:yes stop_codon:yes gene_type:complete